MQAGRRFFNVAFAALFFIISAPALPAARAADEPPACPPSIGDVPYEKKTFSPPDATHVGQLICDYEDPKPKDGHSISLHVDVEWTPEPQPARNSYICLPPPATLKYNEQGVFQEGKVATRGVWVEYSGGPAYIEGMQPVVRDRVLRVRALARDQAKKFHDAMKAKSGACGQSSPPPGGGCAPHGIVTDHRGRPVAGIHVRLEQGSRTDDVATDDQGGYRFATVSPSGGAKPDPVVVSVLTEDWPAHARINHDDTLGRASSDPIPPTGDDCKRDFPVNLPDRYVSADPGRDKWADIIDLYQNIKLAAQLATQELGIAWSSPLDVYGWCVKANPACPARQGQAGSEFGLVNVKAGGEPFVGLGEGASMISAVNKPDNLEFHEFGHAAMTLAYGAFPNVRETHGGYGEFDSAGSFLEGWAEFYSVMVAKHIAKRPFPELYRQGGGYWNLEENYPPWTLGGTTEEYSVAGLLLDLEDGTADYATARPVKQYTVDCCIPSKDGKLVSGSVTYTRTASDPAAVPASSEWTIVVVQFGDGSTATVPVEPALLAPGQTGVFGVPLPAGAAAKSTTARALEGRPGDILVDDDSVDLSLQELWGEIRAHTSRDRRAGQHVVTVADLYDAVHAGFGGKDNDHDGVDDIDSVFRLHGLFADRNGNHTYDNGEVVGLTDHPGRPSRRNPESSPATLAGIDTRDVGSRVQVQVQYPKQGRSYGYTAARDASGKLMLAVPPRGSGATLSLIAYAEGYEPALLGTIKPDEYWTEADKHPTQSFLNFQATMVPVASSRAASSKSSFPVIPVGVAAVVLFVSGFVLKRRRRPAAVQAPAALACPSCGQPATGTRFCLTCGAQLMP
jgi:hypothetical protein